MSKKNNYLCEGGIKKIFPSWSSFGITWQASWYRSVILGMDFYLILTLMIYSYSLGKPRDANQWSSGRIFYPILTLMIDSNSLSKPCDAKLWSSGRIFYPILTLRIDSYNL